MQTEESSPIQGVILPKGFPGLPSDWESDWETFPSSDGKLQLFGMWLRAKKPDPALAHRCLIVLHGMGEHSGRYLHFSHYLKNTVGSIYCIDHRGHGRSEGLRGHVDRFDSFADDTLLAIRRVQEHLKKRYGKAEIHLFGHSMGGLITLRALLLQKNLPLHSVTVSAPLLGIKAEVPVVKKTAGILLSKIWGSLHMTNVVDPSILSHDPEVVKAYKSDRLVHAKVTPKFFTELQKAMSDTKRRGGEIEYPIEFIIPLDDKLVDSDATLLFFKTVHAKDKQLRTYPGFFHESFNEVGKEKPFEDLISWIMAHRAH